MQALRLVLECGDTSSLRTKKTPEGYTHDWEVFVRGVDNAPIHHYIEKVVFILHDTFPKPKRVVKEPPYCVKESGYAGFDIPIHIYLKNKNEPKKFEIMYNLNLETSVPTVSHHTLHTEIIVNPSEEFRKKLLKGGATHTNDSSSEKSELRTMAMVGKPKLSGNAELKKHRIPEPKVSSQFSDLFGTPIKTVKHTQESKKSSEKPSIAKVPAAPEKSEKVDKSVKVKHSPHKDSKKDKSSEERKEKRDKEKDGSKDKEKSKEKSKRSSSPINNKISHPSAEKRPSSPSMKKPISPSLVPKRLSSPTSKPKEKDSKKDSEKDRDKEREKEKSKENPKSSLEEVKSEKSEKESKSERKKDKKKHKEDRDKEKKDKHRDKEREKSRDKEGVKSSEKKIEKTEKVEKEKPEAKPSREERKSPKVFKESEKVKEEKVPKIEKPEKSEKEKSKESKSEKSDKSKHKHKKKDKKEKRDGSREREKKEKREKSKSSSEHKTEVTNHNSTITPVPTRIPEILDRDSSESSGDEDSIVESRLSGGSASKKEVAPTVPPAEVHRTMSPPPVPVADKKDKSERKRDRSKSRREERENKKRKRKSESKGLDDEISPTKKNKDRDHSTSPLVEPVSSSQSPIATNAELLHSKSKHVADEQVTGEPAAGDSEQVAPDSTNSTLVDTEEPLVFSEDYVLQLKELQQKIMTLQDNQELQRVVQVIAETGQYEITKKTFDFDLCALDRRTVQRLQQFFAS